MTIPDHFEVYARWTAYATRPPGNGKGVRNLFCCYMVHHAGGSTAKNVNQRTNGGVWNHLGRYTMNPSSNHRVEVSDSTTGTVVADAVRFVSVTTSGAGIDVCACGSFGDPAENDKRITGARVGCGV